MTRRNPDQPMARASEERRDAASRRPLRVLLLLTSTAGGAGLQNYLIAKHLSRADFDLTIAFGPGYPLDAEYAKLDVPCIHLSMSRRIAPLTNVRGFFQIRRLLEQGRFDIVCTSCSIAGLMGRVAAALTHVPVVDPRHSRLRVPAPSASGQALGVPLDRAATGCADHRLRRGVQRSGDVRHRDGDHVRRQGGGDIQLDRVGRAAPSAAGGDSERTRSARGRAGHRHRRSVRATEGHAALPGGGGDRASPAPGGRVPGRRRRTAARPNCKRSHIDWASLRRCGSPDGGTMCRTCWGRWTSSASRHSGKPSAWRWPKRWTRPFPWWRATSMAFRKW